MSARNALLILIVLVSPFSAEHLLAQAISGQVTDARSHEPLPLALVVIGHEGEQLGTAVTNDRGFFRIALPGGFHRQAQVEVSRLGYAPIVWPVQIDSAFDLSLAIELHPQPIPLEPVRVTGTAGSARLRAVGFDRRRRTGFGRFVSRTDIEKRRPVRSSDLFRAIPGLAVLPAGGGGGFGVIVTRAQGRLRDGPCAPRILVNGLVVAGPGEPPLDLDAFVHPDALEGIEVYRGPAEIPPQFGGSESDCGVVLLWTR